MIGSGVVRNLVLDDFDAQLVGIVHQLAQLRQIAEMLLHAVEINRAVAVVVRNRLVVVTLAFVQMVHVVVDRRQPERGPPSSFR